MLSLPVVLEHINKWGLPFSCNSLARRMNFLLLGSDTVISCCRASSFCSEHLGNVRKIFLLFMRNRLGWNGIFGNNGFTYLRSLTRAISYVCKCVQYIALPLPLRPYLINITWMAALVRTFTCWILIRQVILKLAPECFQEFEFLSGPIHYNKIRINESVEWWASSTYPDRWITFIN